MTTRKQYKEEGLTPPARRTRGSGSLFRKGTSLTWHIQYYRDDCKRDENGELILDPSGSTIPHRQRVRECTNTQNRRKAQDRLNERLSEVSRNEWVAPERQQITVEALFLAMENKYRVDHGLSNQVTTPLRRRWAHLKKSFAHTPAAKLTTDALTRYTLQRQKEGAKNATINRELASLRRALRLGQRSTPPKVREIPHFFKLPEDNVRTGFLDPEKYATLAANASNIGVWMRAIFELAYTWGWRKGELRLLVRQVDFNANVVRLEPGTTKNKKGREVTMTPNIRALLMECASGKKADDFLFTRKDGSAVKDLRDAWRDLCTASGVPGLLLHDLRRTAVRNLVRAGVSEHTAMAISGHKTRSVFDRYDIVNQRDIRDAMLKLERARAETAKSENGPVWPPNGLETTSTGGEAGSAKVQ